MTENSYKILKFLQKHPGECFLKRDLSDLANVPVNAVAGTIANLLVKGYVTEEVKLHKDQYGIEERLKFVGITKEGETYDPYEEERRKARINLEQKALRREQRREEKLQAMKQLLKGKKSEE